MMKTKNSWLNIAIIATALLSFAACDSENSPKYDVTVGWTISNTQVCETIFPNKDRVKFDEIQIKVFEEGEIEPLAEYSANCTDYFYEIQNLDRGTYTVELGAMAKYKGEYLPYYQAQGEIGAPAEDDQAYEFQLAMGTGEIKVNWDFNSGFCVTNEVETVSISLEGSNVGNKHNFEDVKCEDEFLLVEDVDWDTYHLSMQGFNQEGIQTHSGEAAEDFEVKPGSLIESEAFVLLAPI